MIKYTGLIIALTISGCHLTPDQLEGARSASATIAAQAEAAYDGGRYQEAVDLWQRATASIPDEPELYFQGRLYLDEYEYRSSSAWALLELGRRDEAAAAFDAIANDLPKTEAARERYLRDVSQQIAARNLALQAAFGLAASFDNAPPAFAQMYSASMHLPVVVELDESTPPVVEQDWLERTPFRSVAFPAVEPLSYIGRLTTGSSFCTASLVGRRLALTNAHCVTDYETGEDWTSARGKNPNDLHLTFSGFAAPDMVNVLDYDTHLGRDWSGDPAEDWAILYLDRHPIQRGWLGWLDDPGATMQRTHRIMLGGYSGDLNEGEYLTLHYDCPANKDGNRLRYRCERAPGSSGSPILLAEGKFKHYYVVGVHNAGSRVDKLAGVGVHVKQFADALRSAQKKVIAQEGS